MRYAIYDFVKGTRLEELARNMIAVVIDTDTQCRVVQSTTVEDEMYLGTDWQCDHCLPPTQCVNCNPAYRHADWKHCVVCHPDPGSTAMTWHTGDTCLKCNTTRDTHADEISDAASGHQQVNPRDLDPDDKWYCEHLGGFEPPDDGSGAGHCYECGWEETDDDKKRSKV